METKKVSRWNDCSTMSIIHTPTEEERKKATDEMVDNAIKNAKKFENNEDLIEKARKALPIGTERMMGGKMHVKTAKGWRPKGKGRNSKKEDEINQQGKEQQDISSYASKASDEQLKAAIEDVNVRPEVKAAAEEELKTRKSKDKEKNSNSKQIEITEALQRVLDVADEIGLNEEEINKLKTKLEENKKKKEVKPIDEKTLDFKLDKLKQDISDSIDKKLNEMNGFKKITQTYVKVNGQTIVLNMKDEDRYKAKKGDFYMESEPHEPLGEFKKRVKEAFEKKQSATKVENKIDEVIPEKPQKEETLETEEKPQKEETLDIKETQNKEVNIEDKLNNFFKSSIELFDSQFENGKPYDYDKDFAEKYNQFKNIYHELAWKRVENFRIGEKCLIYSDEKGGLTEFEYKGKNEKGHHVFEEVGGNGRYETKSNTMGMRTLDYPKLRKYENLSRDKFLDLYDDKMLEHIKSKEFYKKKQERILKKAEKLKSITQYKDTNELMKDRLKQDSLNNFGESSSKEMKELCKDFNLKGSLKEQVEKQVNSVLKNDNQASENRMNLLITFMQSSNEDKLAINNYLMQKNLMPIINGYSCNVYNGEKYNYYETIESSLPAYKKAARKRNKNEYEKYLSNYVKNPDYTYIRDINNEGRYSRFIYPGFMEVVNEGIDRYIKDQSLEENLVLNRWLRLDDPSNIDAKEILTAKEGDIIEDLSYSSFTSSNDMEGLSITADFKITLLAKKGQQIANVNNKEEHEYMTNKGSKFRVLKKGFGTLVVELLD